MADWVCWVLPLLALVASIRNLRGGWDDGAITAAFARTFAETGRMALTPTSEQVEGFSSASWMLILAAGAKTLHSSTGILVWMKLASALSFAGALFLFRRVAARFVDGLFVPFAVIVLAFTVTPFTETVNGMEMNFYMLLILALADLLFAPDGMSNLRIFFACLFSCAAISTRFEAPLLLLVLYLGIYLEPKKDLQARKALVWLVPMDGGYFAAMEWWRWRSFGAWVPNTALAKRWPPYNLPGVWQMLASRKEAVSEIAAVLFVPLLSLAVLWAAEKLRGSSASRNPSWIRHSPLLVLVTAAALLLDLALGKSWGHPCRMILGFLPFIVLLITSGLRAIVREGHLALALSLSVVLLLHVCAWVSSAATALRPNVTSVRNVERIGTACDRVRQRLHRQTLSVFTPDVGGAALCCEHLTILDAGLLSNHAMSESGFSGSAAFLKANRPDAIQTHGTWAQRTRLYSSGFLHDYRIVESNGSLLYLRSELYRQLMNAGLPEIPMDDGSHLCGQEVLPEGRADVLYLASIPRCIHLPE